ncbi:MAG: hypothetical protein JXA14_04490 [Anaerolineae bacterium]|nr:hypothetical protein [Anaerolineae bacterium]
MNRQLIVAGLVVFGLLLFFFLAVTLAAPSLQTVDTEPNNNFDEANNNPISLSSGSASATGDLTYQVPGDVYTDVIDYYIAMPAEFGRQYRASLNPYGSVGGLTLKINLYDADRDFLDDDNSVIQWTAYTNTYYLSVQALVATTTTLQSCEYILNINRLGITPTPTPSNTPTNTPDPTNTPFPTSVSNADPYEDYYHLGNNDEFSRAYTMPVATSLELSSHLGKANFHTVTDLDWYAFWGKDDKWYQITTSGLSGVDTYVTIYKDNGTKKITSNDDGGGGLASLALFKASYDGFHYIRVTNKVNATGSYNMKVEEFDEPTPEPTATLGPGANSKADPCEDNLDFGHACIIAANTPKKFNFVPPYGGVDNDFFKLRIKPGYNYECFTSDLDAGVDPNMIVFTGTSWDSAVGGNDDVEPGDLNSYFAYYATYEGWLYVLVGYGDRTPSDIYNSNYTLECKAAIPGEPTATTGPAVTGTPRATGAPPTATPFVGLKIRPLTTPTPVPETPSEPSLVPISLLVYYDANGDGQPGAGEGVAGISAQAYEVSTNSLLAQGITDEQGYLEFTVTAQGPVRVTVPFFGFSQLVTEEATIRLRVLSSALP